MKFDSPPSTMRAAQGQDYGDIDEMISVRESITVPRLDDAKSKNKKMIIKTLAVALAPGDVRVLSGRTRKFQGPPSFPYIPGGDCCGIVMELPNKNNKNNNNAELPFSVGDLVAVRFDAVPRGALCEYACVSTNVADKVPNGISPIDAAALVSSTPATLLSDRIRTGERVLILGAGGGEGSHVCQHARNNGASFIVGVSQTPQRLLDEPLNCDEAIDYTQHDVYNMKQYQDKPFDTIIDLATGGWPRLLQQNKMNIPSIVKPASQGGRYLTMSPDIPWFDGPNIWSLLVMFLFTPIFRALKSRLWCRKSLPKFSYVMALPSNRNVVTRTLKLAKENLIKAVVDGPYPFTTQGVRDAFHKQLGRHPKGKVIIKVADIE